MQFAAVLWCWGEEDTRDDVMMVRLCCCSLYIHTIPSNSMLCRVIVSNYFVV